MSTRREFITLLGGVAAAWPLVARAQQAQPMRRVGVLMHVAAADAEAQLRLAAFMEGLQEAGWSAGRNVQIDARWSPGDFPRLFRDAAALVATHPDVILAGIGATTQALQQATKTVPIVFAQGVDPVGNSYVDSLARPGGNTTTRDDLAPAFDRLANRKAQALIVPVNGLFQVQGVHIVQLAIGARLPTIFAERYGVEVGGLASYGVDQSENFRHAAVYVDKILKGAKPGDLPIEFPSRIELIINLKTAKTLGLDIPLHIQQRADEVIE